MGGGGGVVMAFTFLFGTRDVVVHALAVGLTAALLAFVLYLIFALEHPYVGDLCSRPSTPTCLRRGRCDGSAP